MNKANYLLNECYADLLYKRRIIERNIIGAILINPAHMYVALDYIKPGNFSNYNCRQIFTTCQQIAVNKEPLDFMSAFVRIDPTHQTNILIDHNTLFDIVNKTLPTPHGIQWHCVLLIELGLRNYLAGQLWKHQHYIPPELIKDYKDFENHVLNCSTDILKVLEAGTNYFQNVNPSLAKRLQNVQKLIDQKARLIKKKHGLSVLEQSLEHYRNLSK